VQHVDLRAALGRLAQAMRNQRMVLAQERADHPHAVERAESGDRHAEPRDAFRPAIGGEVGVAQAEIAAPSLREIQLFERRMRRGEDTDVLLLQPPTANSSATSQSTGSTARRASPSAASAARAH